MKYRLTTWLLATCVLISFSATTATAQIFGGRVTINRPWNPWQQPAGYPNTPRRAPTYDEYYQYMNSQFPKYYGGFHASYFQSIGVPPGDIGLRGNGIFATPW